MTSTAKCCARISKKDTKKRERSKCTCSFIVSNCVWQGLLPYCTVITVERLNEGINHTHNFLWKRAHAGSHPDILPVEPSMVVRLFLIPVSGIIICDMIAAPLAIISFYSVTRQWLHSVRRFSPSREVDTYFHQYICSPLSWSQTGSMCCEDWEKCWSRRIGFKLELEFGHFFL